MPTSLYSALVPDKNSLGSLCDALHARRKHLTAIWKNACFHQESHPLPKPLPLLLRANTFFKSHGLFSTSDRPPPSPVHSYTQLAAAPLQVMPKQGRRAAHKRKLSPRRGQQGKRSCHKMRTGPSAPVHHPQASIQEFLGPMAVIPCPLIRSAISTRRVTGSYATTACIGCFSFSLNFAPSVFLLSTPTGPAGFPLHTPFIY